MNSHENGLSTMAVWGEQGSQLKEFVHRYSLPSIAKVVKGHYRNIGSGIWDQNQVYIHSVQISQKVLAEGIKQNGRKIGRNGMKFSLPVTYGGWFELLSEDGKPIMAIPSVADLIKIAPQQCLVREAFRALVSISSGGTAADNVLTEKIRVVQAGEKLTLCGESEASIQTVKGVVKTRFLRCTDESGTNVFLRFDQRAQFSPVAGINNISGVHTIRGLLEKFRLPIIVRLVHGIIPARVEKNFTAIFRLVGAYTDETVFVLPLKKDSKMVTISTRESLLMVGVRNQDAVGENPEFVSCVRKCETLVKSYMNTIHILVDLPDAETIKKGREQLKEEQMRKKELQNPAGANVDNGNATSDEEAEILFEEIEEIYRYIREGGDPPPPRTRRAKTTTVQENLSSSSSDPTRLPADSAKAPLSELPKPDLEYQEETVDMSEEGVAAGRSENTDDDYWEEPIYEDIAKIRERKMADKLLDDKSRISGIDVESNIKTEQKIDSQTSGELVQTLRQAYTRNLHTEEVAPPIPPKCFDEVNVEQPSPSEYITPIRETDSQLVTQVSATKLIRAGEHSQVNQSPVTQSEIRKSISQYENSKVNTQVNQSPVTQAEIRKSISQYENSKVNKIGTIRDHGAKSAQEAEKSTAKQVQATAKNTLRSLFRTKKQGPKVPPKNPLRNSAILQSIPIETSKTTAKSIWEINDTLTSPRNSLLSAGQEKVVHQQNFNRANPLTVISKTSETGSGIRNDGPATNVLSKSSDPPLSTTDAIITNPVSVNPPHISSQILSAVSLEVNENPILFNSSVPSNPITISNCASTSMSSISNESPTTTASRKSDVSSIPGNSLPTQNPVTESLDSVGTIRFRNDSAKLEQIPSRADSPSRPIVFTTNSNPYNWSPNTGSAVANDATSSVSTNAGVTTIHVSNYRNDSGFPGKPNLHSSYQNNTQIYVRHPGSVGHAIYRPQVAPATLHIHAGKTYFTNASSGNNSGGKNLHAENDNWV